MAGEEFGNAEVVASGETEFEISHTSGDADKFIEIFIDSFYKERSRFLITMQL